MNIRLISLVAAVILLAIPIYKYGINVTHEPQGSVQHVYEPGDSLQGGIGNFITLVDRDTGQVIKGIVLVYDLPHTFESGSCVAGLGTLVKEGVTFYCYEKSAGTLEKLSDVK